jgi:dimethylhistidine N-methyltransferase
MKDITFEKAVVEGLTSPVKAISPKYLYDRRGSELFDRICDCRDYYVTRTETAILEAYSDEIVSLLGPAPVVFELGSGASRKTRILLKRLEGAACYIPIDISREFLQQSARSLQDEFPGLSIVPVCADFAQALPPDIAGVPSTGSDRKVAFFPGSTLGNFHPEEAVEFLSRTARFLGREGNLLIGIDLLKDRSILEPAYDDEEGWTAAFNLNLLERMRAELGATVDPRRFRHRAWFNERENRVEMHLESVEDQSFDVAGRTIRMNKGESIHTECSYKYSPERFEAMAREAGYELRGRWTDPKRLFAVYLLRVVRIPNPRTANDALHTPRAA